MKKIQSILLASLLLLCGNGQIGARTWTLKECLAYALENNIQLKQKVITTQSSREDVLQSKSALFPSLSFTTSQSMNYRPFSKQTITLDGGTMSTSSNAVSYTGNYGINAQWTVWNGNKNHLDIKQRQLDEQQNEYAEQVQANTIQEQITKLYVQILYEADAVKVNEAILKASEMQVERAKAMVEVGSLANVDKVQLEAQAAQDALSLVTAQTQLANYKLQLKQLLEIHDSEPFDVAVPEIADSKVLSPIPQKELIYADAIEKRPEIKSQQVAIENSDLMVKSARSGYMPTVSMNGGIGTNHFSSEKSDYLQQMKYSLSYQLGVSVAMPLFDNHRTRTNIRKAKYSQETARLQLQDTEKKLYSTIENYYLDATTSQQRYVYAKKNEESMSESYSLVSEQFRLGLKNIVELTTGKNNLLKAEQQLLETKYTALYNMAMLRYYQGEAIEL